MTKQEIEPFVGKFVEIKCSYYINRKSMKTRYLEACGHVIKLEDKYLLFKDNDNPTPHLVALEKVWGIEDRGKRRTAKQWAKIQLKEAKKKQKEAMKTERL
jgi:hypothetical protein